MRQGYLGFLEQAGAEVLRYKIDGVPFVTEYYARLIQEGKRIFLFSGNLGSGKTTLVTDILTRLGVAREKITSPTYAYVNKYQLDNQVIYHFDLYRIEQTESFFEHGFDDYLRDRNALCFIEWPDVISELIARDYKDITVVSQFSYTDDFSDRYLKVLRK